jgi:hypothetical protein
MEKVWEFLKNPFGSWLRVFATVVLGLWLTDLTTTGIVHFDASEWGIWLTSGLVAILPIFIAYINPTDTRFGRGSQ